MIALLTLIFVTPFTYGAAIDAQTESPPMKMPAVGIAIPQSTDFETPGDLAWTKFGRFQLNNDLTFGGTFGIGGAVGLISDNHGLFFDVAFNFYLARYGSFTVFQTGAGDLGPTPLDPNSEVGRPRSPADQATFLILQPGVGRTFTFFRNKRWLQTARFGVGYGQYNDEVNDVAFRGPVISFHVEAGYKFKKLILAPGVTWNHGFMTASGQPGYDTYHYRYLPLQWFTMDFSVYVWF